MTDPMTTTRDGDVLTTQDLVDKVKHLGYALQHGGGGVVLPDLEDIVRSHRALQQRLDAAEQRAERMYNAIDWATTETFTTPVDLPEECFPRSTWNRIYERLRAALTEQESTDA